MVDNVQIWTDYWWKRTSNLWNWKYWEKVEKSDNCFQIEMRWLWPNLTTIVAALSGAFRAKGKRLRLATQNHFYTIEDKKIQILKSGFSDLPFTTFLSRVRVSRSRQDPERGGCISNSTSFTVSSSSQCGSASFTVQKSFLLLLTQGWLSNLTAFNNR